VGNSTFSTNQHGLIEHQAAREFFGEIADVARERGWLPDAHFTVDGTLIQARAGLR
jgi:hypothetical protein